MKQVNSKKAPAAIGPYSQAIMAKGIAIYVSGQLPIDSKTGKFAGNTIESQTKQSIENVKVILEEAGYTLQDVVKSTVLLNDIKDFAAMNGVYADYFKGVCPARAAFQVAALPMGALVEVEVVAVK